MRGLLFAALLALGCGSADPVTGFSEPSGAGTGGTAGSESGGAGSFVAASGGSTHTGSGGAHETGGAAGTPTDAGASCGEPALTECAEIHVTPDMAFGLNCDDECGARGMVAKPALYARSGLPTPDPTEAFVWDSACDWNANSQPRRVPAFACTGTQTYPVLSTYGRDGNAWWQCSCARCP